MSDLATAPAGAKTPVWFWIAAALLTLWNAFGVFDYVMSQMAPEAYMAEMTAEQQAYFTGLPTWHVAIWATAVFAAFFGSLFLLLKKSWALPLSAAAVVLYIVSSLYSYVFQDAGTMIGMVGTIISAVIFLALVFQAWLARWAKGRGILS